MFILQCVKRTVQRCAADAKRFGKLCKAFDMICVPVRLGSEERHDACGDGVLGKCVEPLVQKTDPSVQVREVLTDEFLSEIRQEIEKKLS